jgi:LacI family transcriptional regulator
VSEATRARVQRAAEALSYIPSESGRTLSTRATRRVGVVAAELTNPFYPELVEPLRAELELAGYRTVLIPDRPEAPIDIDRLADGSLDGVVVTTATLGSALPHRLALRGMPFVLLNREVDGVDADVCVADNVAGAAAIADLVARNHRVVAAILGPLETSTGRDREAGLRLGLSEHGVALSAKYTRRGAFSYATGHAAALELLALRPRPTVICCGNDVIALGALNAVAAFGFVAGRDVAVTGFDDIAPAAWELFRLTTVRCDLARMARQGVALLAARIRDPELPTQRVLISPELVVRDTHLVKPPRVNGRYGPKSSDPPGPPGR